MNNIEVIAALNSLIRVCKDGEEGYNTWLEDSQGRATELKVLFSERLLWYSAAISELQDLVLLQNGDPETTGTVLAAIHIGLTSVKATILGMDDDAALSECVLIEETTAETYSKALENVLPPQIHSIVENQHQVLLRSREFIKHLRRELKPDISIA
jgi:uncharacterized protein (TIGR02284 family)